MFGKKLSRIRQKEVLAACGAGFVLFLLSVFLAIPLNLGLYSAVFFTLVVLAFLVVYGKVHEDIRTSENKYRQVEELFTLFRFTDLRAPLPPLRGWALSPDVANILLGIIAHEKPKKVLDLGSGTSTVLMAYALEKNGMGSILGIDHDAEYAERTRVLLREHSLEKIANVRVAPLSDVEVQKGKWRWYEPSFLKDVGHVDLVFIDGPPDRSHFLARYPALPLLINDLSPNAVIVIDDAFSPAEKEMVKRWLVEYPDFQAQYFPTEKGTCVLRRKGKS
jgi:predicted O-methyltransferase YrrM